jgi:ABC-2 type transport system ATP-binding protein
VACSREMSSAAARASTCGAGTLGAVLLRARHLSKRYGSVRALDDVSFEIGEGITGLLGSNGAGKTTSLKLFIGLIDQDSGSVELLGRDSRESPDARLEVGYAPEHDCLPSTVSAAEFLAYMAEVSGLPRTAARLRASDVLRHVGLFEERYRPMGTYSTGMKQRVKLAQALVHDPRIAFLDEPTAGLDPIGRREMLELIRRVGRDFGIAIVVSTHLMGDVERTCDSVIVLDAGRVLRSGAVSSFTEETETLVVELVEGAAALAQLLEQRGLSAQLNGSRLTLEQVAGDDYDTLRDAIVDSGAVLYRLAPARLALSDVFIPAAAATAEESGGAA